VYGPGSHGATGPWREPRAGHLRPHVVSTMNFLIFMVVFLRRLGSAEAHAETEPKKSTSGKTK